MSEPISLSSSNSQGSSVPPVFPHARKTKSFATPLWMTSVGPWPSINAAVTDLNAQWSTSITGVGVLQKGASQCYNTSTPPGVVHIKKLYCYNKSKSQCQFCINLESRTDGSLEQPSSWEIASIGHACNHVLPTTQAEKNVYASQLDPYPICTPQSE
jgi:hypothetical protein